jgi:hypothetical protein
MMAPSVEADHLGAASAERRTLDNVVAFQLGNWPPILFSMILRSRHGTQSRLACHRG